MIITIVKNLNTSVIICEAKLQQDHWVKNRISLLLILLAMMHGSGENVIRVYYLYSISPILEHKAAENVKI
jgi:hypothetical protein